MIFLIVVNPNLSDEIRALEDSFCEELMGIFSDLNSIYNHSEIYKIFPKEKFKEMMYKIKTISFFENFNESQLYSIICERLLYNLKLVIVYENAYQTVYEDSAKSLYNILYTGFPQLFNKMKTKKVEEFIEYHPIFKVKFRSKILFKMKPEVTEIILSSYTYELELAKFFTNGKQRPMFWTQNQIVLMVDFLWELLTVYITKKSLVEEADGVIDPQQQAIFNKIDEIEKNTAYIKLYIQERKDEIEKLKINIEEIQNRLKLLNTEIDDLRNKKLTVEGNIEGFLNEENVQNKLAGLYNEEFLVFKSTNPKEYAIDVSNWTYYKLFYEKNSSSFFLSFFTDSIRKSQQPANFCNLLNRVHCFVWQLL